MERIFICLANSKKYSGRCIAGIEIQRDDEKKWQLCRHSDGNVRWIRPVARTEHGAVPVKEVQHINLLDFVVFDAAEECPKGYQSENVYYSGQRFEVLSNLKSKPENIDQLTLKNTDMLLGNQEKSLRETEIKLLQHSIVLIKTDTPQLKFQENGSQLRCTFLWMGKYYDLPVTDIEFHLKWIDDPTLLANKQHSYLCVSLSMPFETRYHKLIAGIICI